MSDHHRHQPSFELRWSNGTKTVWPPYRDKFLMLDELTDGSLRISGGDLARSLRVPDGQLVLAPPKLYARKWVGEFKRPMSAADYLAQLQAIMRRRGLEP